MHNLRVDIVRLFAPYSPNVWTVLERRWQQHRYRDRLMGGRWAIEAWVRKRERIEAAADMRRCVGTTLSDKRCRRDALTNSALCGMHVTR